MTDTNNIEPKPCPFCGKTNTKRHCDHASGWIGCECGASGPRIKLDVDRYPGDSFRPNEEQKVVSAWNRRALSARASAGEGGDVEQLRRERDFLVEEYERAVGCGSQGYIHCAMHLFNAITNAQAGASGGSENYAMEAIRAGEGGITAEFVTGYMMAPIGNPDAWPENYANGFNDCAKTCVEQVAHAFAEWNALNTAAPQPATGEEELANALRKWQAVLRSDAECAGLNNGYRNACEHHAAHIDTLLAAAPQPAQAQKDESPTITSGGIVEVNPAKAIRYAYQQGNVKKGGGSK